MQWFYNCNGKQYASKFQAIKENINTGHPVHFNANETWNGYDFSAEPEETWSTLLKQEAIKLRESYSYIKLWYSGGADSDLVLTTFIQNNIHIDEICCSKSGLGNADYEIDNFAMQYLKQVEPMIPNTKITILEPKIKDYKDYYMHSNWSTEVPEWNYAFRMIYHNDIIKDHNTKSEMINVFGAEPPRLAYRNKKWYMYFLDGDIESAENKYNFFVEDPKVHAKQCHMLLRGIKASKKEHEYNEICNLRKHEVFCRDHTGRHDFHYIFPRRIEFWGDFYNNFINFNGDKLYYTAQKEKNALEKLILDYPELIRSWKDGLYDMYDIGKWVNGVPEQGLINIHTKFYSLEDNSVETVDSLYPEGFLIDE